MKAIKGNRQYTISEKEKQEYINLGFDIVEDGKIIAYGNGKTVPYSEYKKIEAELAAMKAKYEAEETATTELESMNIDELKAYAETNGINIGNATSKEGILKKIQSV